jgi:hypothetical protein
MFNDRDLIQIKERGSDVAIILQQIKNFKNGFPFANLLRPATIDDGINRFSENEINELVAFYDRHGSELSVIKFVPASGAASRMFQVLYSYLEDAKNPDLEIALFEKDKGFNSVNNFISHLKSFAFFHDLKKALADQNFELEIKLEKHEFSPIIDYLLNDKGLGYGKMPKGLLKFHNYPGKNRMAFEEHIVEAANYASSGSKLAYIHFTVSPEHLNRFKASVEQVKVEYEKQFGLSFNISFSLQKSSTDTLAVDLENKPFRENGQLIFRPGGHGALIENLNDLDADLVFIKNIDNVVPDRLKASTTQYKKAIGGLLLKFRKSIFDFLIELNGEISDDQCNRIVEFSKNNLNLEIPEEFHGLSLTQKKAFLMNFLNRPIRVCGMVKNEGEPGGGPFWVKNSRGSVGLQIVESSQVNANDKEQMNILKSATHFNPVDLVCGIKDYKGNRFDLHKFIDPETGFISQKSKDGKTLKAQELPGLWNGAMADWITIFVEVPVITFNPVKTVNDLLRPQHQ